MKLKQFLVFLLIATAAPMAFAQSSLSSEAQHAYMSGDLETAKKKFQIILAQDPDNVVARNYLKSIALAQSVGSGPSKQYKSLIIPNVEFKDATLGSVLDCLKGLAAKVSDGKVQPNFVLKPGVNNSASITMSLRNVPFTELLRYLGDMASVQFSIEEYAITVTPKGGPAQ